MRNEVSPYKYPVLKQATTRRRIQSAKIHQSKVNNPTINISLYQGVESDKEGTIGGVDSLKGIPEVHTVTMDQFD